MLLRSHGKLPVRLDNVREKMRVIGEPRVVDCVGQIVDHVDTARTDRKIREESMATLANDSRFVLEYSSFTRHVFTYTS